ncbi:hypothetical protein BsWGS_21888 [Bradybaena similaris]
MTSSRTLSVFLIALMISALTLTTSADKIISDCYETWSRCSGWSSWATDWLWKNCDYRCKGLGRRGGRCVEVPSKCFLSKTALQCQCY